MLVRVVSSKLVCYITKYEILRVGFEEISTRLLESFYLKILFYPSTWKGKFVLL